MRKGNKFRIEIPSRGEERKFDLEGVQWCFDYMYNLFFKVLYEHMTVNYVINYRFCISEIF